MLRARPSLCPHSSREIQLRGPWWHQQRTVSQEVRVGAPPEPADWLGALQPLKAVFVSFLYTHSVRPCSTEKGL